MTADTVGASQGDLAVGIRHGLILEIVTSIAKARPCPCKQAFSIRIVWHVALQAHPLFCRRVLEFVHVQMKRQIRVTRQTEASQGPVQPPFYLAPMGIVTCRARSLFKRCVDMLAFCR